MVATSDTIRALAVLVLMALAASACGGSSGKGASSGDLVIDLTQESTIERDADPEPDREDDESVAEAPTPVATETGDATPEETADDSADEPQDSVVEDSVEGQFNSGPVQFLGAELPELPGPSGLPPYESPDRPEGVDGLDSTPDQPAPMIGATFLANDRTQQWSIQAHGLVAGEPTFSSDEGSACWVLALTLTSTWNQYSLTNNSIAIPDVAAITADGEVDSGTDCEVADRHRNGWVEPFDASTVVGGSVNVVFSLLFEGQPDPTVSAIRIGDDDEPFAYLTPEFIDALPVAPVAGGFMLPESLPLVGASMTAGLFDAWAVHLHGLVSVPVTGSAQDRYGSGSLCLVLVGEGFPYDIGEGAVSDSSPHFELVAGGQVVGVDVSSCDTETVEEAGYRWFGEVGQTPGSPASWHLAFLVPERLAGSVSHVIIDEEFDDASTVRLYGAEVIDELPPAAVPRPDPLLPVTSAAMADGPHTWVNVRQEMEWQVSFDGLVEIGPTSDGLARCVVATGSMSPSVGVDAGFMAPDMWLIVDGTGIDALDRRCDTDALKAQGRARWTDFDLDVGESFDFYAPFHLPHGATLDQAVFVLGVPTRDDQALYLDPLPIS